MMLVWRSTQSCSQPFQAMLLILKGPNFFCSTESTIIAHTIKNNLKHQKSETKMGKEKLVFPSDDIAYDF